MWRVLTKIGLNNFNENKGKDLKSNSHLFRYFLLLSLVASVVIIIMTGLGLHSVIHNYVICEAEKDTNRISVAY